MSAALARPDSDERRVRACVGVRGEAGKESGGEERKETLSIERPLHASVVTANGSVQQVCRRCALPRHDEGIKRSIIYRCRIHSALPLVLLPPVLGTHGIMPLPIEWLFFAKTGDIDTCGQVDVVASCLPWFSPLPRTCFVVQGRATAPSR